MGTGALPDLGKLEAALLNVSGETKLDARFRTLFTLKGLGSMSDDRRERVIEIISKGFADDSALLKHELAYVLGQLQDTRALEKLNKVLSDEQEHTMVRHEAAEAMGAISSPQSLPILKKYLEDPDVSIRETCHLAIHKIELENSDAGRKEAELKRQRESTHEDAIAAAARATAPIDPAPALVQGARGDEGAEVNVYTLENVPYFREVLLDTSRTLFDRYRAMFALRDTVKYGSPEAKEPSVQALASALKDNSALFRHEICFVFGELCHPVVRGGDDRGAERRGRARNGPPRGGRGTRGCARGGRRGGRRALYLRQGRPGAAALGARRRGAASGP